MATQQMDAVSSFVHLTDHVPNWLDQLASLIQHASEKNAEFVADYTKVVSNLMPKRVKSPSLQSIHSEDDKSVHLSQIDPRKDAALPTPPPAIEIDPLEAGTKYLYAQAQKKRKPDGSIRSGASGPQRFRSKNQVIIYYDSHLQNELDTMVKAVGVARNNLRKGRNALNASRGFQLPTLSRRYDAATLTPSLENIRSQTISRPGRYNLRSASQAAANEEEACFTDVDKMLENVQNQCETAAHQFLRDGDCKMELDSAQTSLKAILEKAVPTVEVLREKANKEEEEEEARAKEEADGNDTDSEMTLNNPPSMEHLNAISNKMAPTSVSQTLDEMKTRAIMSAPLLPTTTDAGLPTAGMTIEVDDDASEDGSLADLDISQFRLNNARHLRV